MKKDVSMDMVAQLIQLVIVMVGVLAMMLLGRLFIQATTKKDEWHEGYATKLCELQRRVQELEERTSGVDDLKPTALAVAFAKRVLCNMTRCHPDHLAILRKLYKDGLEFHYSHLVNDLEYQNKQIHHFIHCYAVQHELFKGKDAKYFDKYHTAVGNQIIEWIVGNEYMTYPDKKK